MRNAPGLPTFNEALKLDTLESVEYQNPDGSWGFVTPKAYNMMAKNVMDRAVELFAKDSDFIKFIREN